MSDTRSIDDYIAALAPGLASDAGRDVFIDMAKERTQRDFYGHKYNQAVALMAAHIWYLLGAGSANNPGSGNASGGSTGSIVSKHEGDLSVGYGTGAVAATSVKVGDTDLAQTRWGLMLLALRKGCRPFMGVCSGGCHAIP